MGNAERLSLSAIVAAVALCIIACRVTFFAPDPKETAENYPRYSQGDKPGLLLDRKTGTLYMLDTNDTDPNLNPRLKAYLPDMRWRVFADGPTTERK